MMSINSNHSFLAFGREINNSRAWLQSRIFDACGYASEILLDRLTQRLVEISLQPYAAAVKALCKTATNCFPAPGSRIKCGCASMEAGTGRIAISFRQFIANQLDFFLHWAFCLGAILFAGRAAESNQPAVLVFGIVGGSLFLDGSDERFAAYCQSGPIEPLRNGKRFFIQASPKKELSTHAGFIYCDRPLIGLLRGAQIGFSGRLWLAANHALLFLGYVISTLRLPALSLLGKDFAYSAISFDMDRRGLIEAIVLTTANYNNQPLWVRGLQHATTHLAWYAQNFKPIVYASDKLESEIPSARWIRVDTHWVWTNAFADYLKGLGHDKTIKVVGPIVWYLPEVKTPSRTNVDIVIFDVPPFSDDMALRGGGWISNYWHPDNALAFLRDIISIKPQLERIFCLPVTLHLKTKRGYVAGHDKEYFDHINQLENDGAIAVEHPSSNMYSLISGSHLVIVYPFSSPAYIADYVGVPSIYYDPTRLICRDDFGDSPSLINFANCPEGLLDAAVSALRNAFPLEKYT